LDLLFLVGFYNLRGVIVARARKLPEKKGKKFTFRRKGNGSIRKLFAPIGRFLAKILKPLRFLLRPFKTKPAQLLGRFIKKIFFIEYFKSSWYELKEVTWPGRKETIQLTFAVFIFAVSFGLFIAVIDFGLDKLFKGVLLK